MSCLMTTNCSYCGQIQGLYSKHRHTASRFSDTAWHSLPYHSQESRKASLILFFLVRTISGQVKISKRQFLLRTLKLDTRATRDFLGTATSILDVAKENSAPWGREASIHQQGGHTQRGPSFLSQLAYKTMSFIMTFLYSYLMVPCSYSPSAFCHPSRSSTEVISLFLSCHILYTRYIYYIYISCHVIQSKTSFFPITLS